MNTRTTRWQQRTLERRKDLLVVVDSSSIITLASRIADSDLRKGSPEQPTMLRFLEQLGKQGAEVIIPESVVFECTGWRPSTGTEFPYPHTDSLQYDAMRNFLEQVHKGKVKNVRIEPTKFASEQLDKLEPLKDKPNEYYKKKLKHAYRLSRRDIADWFQNSNDNGNIFVLTEHANLGVRLINTRNKTGTAIGLIDSLKMCSDIQHVAPIAWLDNAVHTDAIRGYINATHEEDNKRRIEDGRAQRKGLNPILGHEQKGSMYVPEGEADFMKVLHDVKNKQQALG